MDAYADERAAIIAEEQLLAVERLSFASPPQSEQEVQRRQGLIQRWQQTALGQSADGATDAAGRQLLIGYQAVKNWLGYWLTA